MDNSATKKLENKYKKDYPKGTRFVVACQKGKIEDVKSFLANNPEVVNQVGKTSWGWEGTGLSATAYKGHTEIVRLLLDNGAKVNQANNNKRTPLHKAANVEIAKLLLDKGAKVNQAEYDGQTPLDMADNDEIEELLIAHEGKYKSELKNIK